MSEHEIDQLVKDFHNNPSKDLESELTLVDNDSWIQFLIQVLKIYGGDLSHDILLKSSKRLLQFTQNEWKQFVNSLDYGATKTLIWFFIFYTALKADSLAKIGIDISKYSLKNFDFSKNTLEKFKASSSFCLLRLAPNLLPCW